VTDRLLIQSISDHPEDQFLKYMLLEEPIHRDYAARCDADYEYFVGWKDDKCNPTWNRITMMQDALRRGYRKIVWLDADTLVVRSDCDIFAETSDTAPLLMTRVDGAHVEIPWGYYDGDTACEAPGWDVYNDGVLIVNDSAHARAALDFAWRNRLAEFRPWHVPGMPELDWLLDYVYDHPDAVEQLDDRWNWMGYPHTCPKDEAVIRAWHGIPYEQRWEQFKAAFDERYALAT
jgi:hypothetical protein